MLAMQYSLGLPADYDMNIIRLRIAQKGALLDGFPDLVFKAYLWAEQGAQSAQNLYAPFYLWRQAAGMNRFLTSEGFAALTRQFGWPSVDSWSVWQVSGGAALRDARYASREILPIPPFSDLTALRQDAEARAAHLQQQGALAVVVAFEPGHWRLVQFALWPGPVPAMASAGLLQFYQVGYVALGQAAG